MAALEVTRNKMTAAAEQGGARPAANVAYLLGMHRPNALPVDKVLFDFNWCVALYAHSDWLGQWHEPVKRARQRGDAAGLGLIQRASRYLLHNHQLSGRYARSLQPQDSWVMASPKTLTAMATQVGIAAMGGVARRMINREDVKWLTSFMGTEGRQQALAFCERYPVFCRVGNRLPARLDTRRAMSVLGTSCLSALLESQTTGVRDRFDLRFGSDARVPLELTGAEQEEARALVQAFLATAAQNEGQA
jgi:hypothetical protein